MTYTYSNTKLEPRLARDVVEAEGNWVWSDYYNTDVYTSPVRLQRIQQVLYSVFAKSGK